MSRPAEGRPAEGTGVAGQHVAELVNVTKRFGQGASMTNALSDVSLHVDAGDRIVVTGPSGAGKSTFLHILCGLDQPTSGLVRVLGTDVTHLSNVERSDLRLREVGIVFQFFSLLSGLTALDNVALPMVLAGTRRREARIQARELLGQLGLGGRLDHAPHELSGGECQRVAIARALANHPKLLLADEPTGNLDLKTGQEVLEVLFSSASDTAIVLVTHDPEPIKWADRHLELIDGSFEDIGTKRNASSGRSRRGG